MKNIFKLMALALATIALGSCDDQWNPDELIGGDGEVDLSTLSIDLDSHVEVISRSDDDKSAIDGFTVKIVNDANGEVAGQWKYAEIPARIKLPVGDYHIDVENSPLQAAAFDAPWLHASKEFSIRKDEVTELGTLTCKVSNLLVSATYSEALRNALGSDVKVQIMAVDDAPLTFTPDETRIGYLAMPQGGNTIIATFEGTVDGKSVKLRKSFGDVKVGQHHVIRFSLNTGSLDPSVIVDADISFEDVDIDIPGNEEPVNGPVITSATLNIEGGDNPVFDGMEAKVHIVAEAGIAHLNVSIRSANLDLEEVGLKNDFDLAYPGELEEALRDDLGFPVCGDVIDATELDFDISQFVPLLQFIPGTHTFVIEVIDNNGNSATATLVFKT